MIIQVKGTILSPLEMQKVLSTLKNGGILVYPTETAYGIGCNAYNAKAIKEIYEIKKRPKNQPLAVIVSSLAMAKQIGVLPSEALTLSKVFHPGPLTIAVPKKPVIPDILNKNGIAFRISSHEIPNMIARKSNCPLVSTSANISGEPAPYSIGAVLSSLDESKIDLVINAGQLEKKQPSTLVDFQMNPPPQIIREGEIKTDAIFDILSIPEKERSNHCKFL